MGWAGQGFAACTTHEGGTRQATPVRPAHMVITQTASRTSPPSPSPVRHAPAAAAAALAGAVLGDSDDGDRVVAGAARATRSAPHPCTDERRRGDGVPAPCRGAEVGRPARAGACEGCARGWVRFCGGRRSEAGTHRSPNPPHDDAAPACPPPRGHCRSAAHHTTPSLKPHMKGSSTHRSPDPHDDAAPALHHAAIVVPHRTRPSAALRSPQDLRMNERVEG